MESNEKQSHDLSDVDSNEEIDDEKLQELVLEAQQEALYKEPQEKTNRKTKHPFPKWLFWLISIVMVFNTFAVIFEVYSIPAIEFLKTSSKLSKQKNIATYKKSVVVIQSAESKGTGFSISGDGTILTNYHVIEGSDTVNVYFPEEGRFTADVVQTYPSVDLAVLKVNRQKLPYLTLAKKTSFTANEAIHFIGNPLSFKGIANEGLIIDYIQLPDWDEPVVMMKAPVYRGNSGSPVLNSKGLVIGIVFATLDHETHGKVGLFIPIDDFYNQQ
ncbi:trypsin-like peptidase domain-containing protein [Sporosarcina sp. E16_3]|uniref:S1C family serine protease n=1 Tax=Sporosarcina sp. E16_3 TaxID=2789293 RepID=UPI001A930DA5|nr:serine protease [Sporosarcina sp. E16_3]MBO0600561.1 trypsin-like peptidase domain-containing protein [Sporosarcina sp. E16_3]